MIQIFSFGYGFVLFSSAFSLGVLVHEKKKECEKKTKKNRQIATTTTNKRSKHQILSTLIFILSRALILQRIFFL